MGAEYDGSIVEVDVDGEELLHRHARHADEAKTQPKADPPPVRTAELDVVVPPTRYIPALDLFREPYPSNEKGPPLDEAGLLPDRNGVL